MSHDHDDEHDRGLAYDLTRLAPGGSGNAISRRAALGLVTAGAAGLVLVRVGAAGAATTTTPQETAGPYPADGSNGPDVLDDSGIVRHDIRAPFGSGKGGAAGGVALKVALRVLHASTGKPVPGAAVYLWHANRLGKYSLYSDGYTKTNYLRGIQVANAQGRLSFQSIFPGCYDGRWPHIHFEVFPSLAKARRGSGRLLTSQIALPKAAAQSVYKSTLYPGSASNLSHTSLSTDMVFRDGWSAELATMNGTIGHAYTAALTIRV